MDRIGITLRELLRYGYGGFILYVFVKFSCPAKTSEVMNFLNPNPVLTGVIGILVVGILVGAAFYAIHRGCVNDLFLERLEHWFHGRLLRGDCVTQYIERTFAVPRHNSRNAYRLIRDSNLFDDRVRNRFHMQNSEIHLLFLTSTAALVTLLPRLISNQCRMPPDPIYPTSWFLMAALAFFVAAFFATIGVCRQERAYVVTLDRTAVEIRLQGLSNPSSGEAPGGGCHVSERRQMQILFHGAVVLFIGLLFGMPFGIAVSRGWSEELVGSWHVAHSGTVAIGVMLIAIGAALHRMVLRQSAASLLVWSLVASAYGFTFGFLVRGIAGVRGFQPSGSPVNLAAFVGNMVGVGGSLLGIALVIYGTCAALKAAPMGAKRS